MMDGRTNLPEPTWTLDRATPPRRDVWQAMARGLRCRCPNCGEGRIFRAFLKVVDKCPACGEVLSHHRADDLPAYLVIVVVGHIVVPIALWIETNYAPSVPLQLAIYLPATLILSLLLLQPIKGAVVGLQWTLRMHGFDETQKDEIEEMTSTEAKVAVRK
jgi:uncharacterized protein (DUF983 family)